MDRTPLLLAPLLVAALAAPAGEPIVAASGTLFSPSQAASLGTLRPGASGTVTFDTGSAERAPSVSGAVSGAGVAGRSASGKVEVAVFVFDAVDLPSGAKVAVTGDRGLVLVAKGSIAIDTLIDLSGAAGTNISDRARADAFVSPPFWPKQKPDKLGGAGGPGSEAGERGKATASAPPASYRGFGGTGRNGENNPGLGMGGGNNLRCRGGSGGGGGAYGGAGGDSTEGSPTIFSKDGPNIQEGGKVYGDAALTDLFGGSSGAGGQNDRNGNFASGGGAGGAIGIISTTSITIGAKGRIAVVGGAGGVEMARGGGGSGGGILLAAPTVTMTAGAELDARGGSGAVEDPKFPFSKYEDAFRLESTRVPGTINPRRDWILAGGGGGGRIAILSNADLGVKGKGATEAAAAGVRLDGGPVPPIVQPDFVYTHPKTGKRTVRDGWARPGAVGTFYDGAWPGLK